MSKRYCGLIKPNLENPYEPFRTVSVEIRDEGGRIVKKYDLEPANKHLGIPFFNGYAWGYAGEGPKALARQYSSTTPKTPTRS